MIDPRVPPYIAQFERYAAYVATVLSVFCIMFIVVACVA